MGFKMQHGGRPPGLRLPGPLRRAGRGAPAPPPARKGKRRSAYAQPIPPRLPAAAAQHRFV